MPGSGETRVTATVLMSPPTISAPTPALVSAMADDRAVGSGAEFAVCMPFA